MAHMVTLEAQLETIPPDNSGKDPDRQTETVTMTGATYQEARDAVEAYVPEGWRVMYVRTIND